MHLAAVSLHAATAAALSYKHVSGLQATLDAHEQHQT